MNDRFLAILERIMQQFGEDILKDTRRLRSVLMDLAPEMKRETILLLNLLALNGHQELKRSEGRFELVCGQLIQHLQHDYSVNEQAAAWTVNVLSRAILRKGFSLEVETAPKKSEFRFLKHIFSPEKTPEKAIVRPIVLSGGDHHIVALQKNGCVLATGHNDFQQCAVAGWKNMTSVHAAKQITFAVHQSGSVVGTGNDRYGQLAAVHWHNIREIVSGAAHTVGLKQDATLKAAGLNNYGQCNVTDWQDIQRVAIGYGFTVGLKQNGKVIAVGYNKNGECNVFHWRDVIRIAANKHVVALKKDGTLVATGNNVYNQCNVGNAKKIADVSVGKYHTVALRRDGTVFAVGNNQFGQCNVSDWKNIRHIMASDCHTIGIRKDATVIIAGLNQFRQRDTASWRNIAAVAASNDGRLIAGATKDGLIVDAGQSDVNDWDSVRVSI